MTESNRSYSSLGQKSDTGLTGLKSKTSAGLYSSLEALGRVDSLAFSLSGGCLHSLVLAPYPIFKTRNFASLGLFLCSHTSLNHRWKRVFLLRTHLKVLNHNYICKVPFAQRKKLYFPNLIFLTTNVGVVVVIFSHQQIYQLFRHKLDVLQFSYDTIWS